MCPEKFIRDNVLHHILQLSVVIVTLPQRALILIILLCKFCGLCKFFSIVTTYCTHFRTAISVFTQCNQKLKLKPHTIHRSRQ